MADRVIRDEIWQSDRFLDLPTDACRLAFLRFLALADDFGNFEGGEKRILRILQACTQIKGPEASSATIDALMACDLIRRYEVEERELFHIPRFKSHRQYLSQRYPASPWCDKTKPLGKDKRIKISGLASDVVTTSLLRSNHVAEGVGVGVGVKSLKPLARSAKAPASIRLGEGQVLETIPLIGEAVAEVCETHLAELSRLYPKVDPLPTLREIRGWNLAKPDRRKTSRGIAAHINSWFQREQNRG